MYTYTYPPQHESFHDWFLNLNHPKARQRMSESLITGVSFWIFFKGLHTRRNISWYLPVAKNHDGQLSSSQVERSSSGTSWWNSIIFCDHFLSHFSLSFLIHSFTYLFVNAAFFIVYLGFQVCLIGTRYLKRFWFIFVTLDLNLLLFVRNTTYQICERFFKTYKLF